MKLFGVIIIETVSYTHLVEKAFQTAVESAVNEKLRGKQTTNKGGQGNAEDAAWRKAMGL